MRTVDPKHIARQSMAVEFIYGVAALVFGLSWLGAAAVGVAGFLGNDLSMCVVGAAAVMTIDMIGLVAGYFKGRFDRNIRRKFLAHYEGQTWKSAGDRLLYFSDISQSGHSVRVCDEEGHNEWIELGRLRRENQAETTPSEKRDLKLVEADIISNRKDAIRGFGSVVGCAVAMFVAGSISTYLRANAMDDVTAGTLATVFGWAQLPLFTACIWLGYKTVLAGMALQRSSDEKYVGTKWTTGDEAEGECVSSWVYPQRLTLKFKNGDEREYPIDQLSMAA